MQEEIVKLGELIMNSIAFKASIGATVTTLIGWAMISIKNTKKKIDCAVTKDQLDEVKDQAFRYTDNRMKIHEDKQILELTNLTTKISETHQMVGKLLDIHLNNKK